MKLTERGIILKRKRSLCLVLSLACSAALTGCMDAMPDMTQEQQALVAEYAADLLLKYSKYYDDGLADLAEMQENETDREEPELEIIEEEETDIFEEEMEVAEVEKEADENEQSEAMAELSDASFAEALGMSDVDISFEQFFVTDAYPEEENAAFFVNAPRGKNMLVVQFSIKNITDDTITCDIATKEIQAYFSVNGSAEKKAMSTPILLDDFTTFRGEVAPDEKASAVMIMEVDSEMTTEDVESITMRVELTDGMYRAKLY